MRRARQQRHGSAAGHALVAAALLVPMSPQHASIHIAVNGIIAFTWVTVMALQARTRH